MADNGYDISDYFTIDPQFGSMEDLKRLIQKSKSKGIKILLDLVVNHTSDEHEWFQAALSDPSSPYRDYYIFKEGKTHPNNWRSIFGGSVWEKLPGEDVYYYHTFGKKQPDLNWENPKLREEVYTIVNRWLELGIAGFRVDAIIFIKKDQTYRSIAADAGDGLAKCTKVSRNQPGIEVFLRELKEKCFDRYNCMTVAEAPGVPYDQLDQLDQFIGDDGYFSMIFDFKHADLDVESGSEWFKRKDWKYSDLYQSIMNSQKAIQNYGWAAPFIENHDQPRSTSKYLKRYATNREAVKSLALMYFFLRGTPFIYQGQEIGMINAERNSIADFDDISSIDQYKRGIEEGLSKEQSFEFVQLRSRDNSRTPMQWSSDQHAGFSVSKPWLAVSEISMERNVQEQSLQRNSILNFYKAMISLRKDPIHEALRSGDIEFPAPAEETIWMYRRFDKHGSYLIVVNLSDRMSSMTWEDSDLSPLLACGSSIQIEAGVMKVPGHSACIFKEY